LPLHVLRLAPRHRRVGGGGDARGERPSPLRPVRVGPGTLAVERRAPEQEGEGQRGGRAAAPPRGRPGRAPVVRRHGVGGHGFGSRATWTLATMCMYPPTERNRSCAAASSEARARFGSPVAS